MKEIQQLLTITEKLRKQHNRKFTLDGKLVGDIGEVLVANKYGLTLLAEGTPHHDAMDKQGRLVQIKSSFRNASTFPTDHVPDFLIAVRILPNGELEELFNGPGKFVVDHYCRHLQSANRPLYNLSGNKLKALNLKICSEDKNQKNRSSFCTNSICYAFKINSAASFLDCTIFRS